MSHKEWSCLDDQTWKGEVDWNAEPVAKVPRLSAMRCSRVWWMGALFSATIHPLLPTYTHLPSLCSFFFWLPHILTPSLLSLSSLPNPGPSAHLDCALHQPCPLESSDAALQKAFASSSWAQPAHRLCPSFVCMRSSRCHGLAVLS